MSSTTIPTRLMAGLRAMTGGIPIPGLYRPRTLGQVKPPVIEEGLELTIDPISPDVAGEQRIVFRVTFRNAGSEMIVLPKNPWVQFVWTYSNGKRQNEVYNDPSVVGETTMLHPGETLVQRVAVMTDNFRYRGITEFRAVFRAAAHIPGMWIGIALSNSVGVVVEAMDEEDAWSWTAEPRQGVAPARTAAGI